MHIYNFFVYRSYGRPSKSVILQASFSKFDSSQLSSSLDPSRNLQSKPLLHIFWTSCSVILFMNNLEK